ncbi:MAG: acetolactate synthase small subunit [Caldilineaceae bacterium]
MKHTLIAWMRDKPGVLNRVAGLLRRRNFNIDSLQVGHSETPGISRMTFVVNGDEHMTDQVIKQLRKVVDVTRVDDVTDDPSIIREMALIRVQTTAETRSEIIQLVDIYKGEIVDVSLNNLVVQIVGSEQRIDALIELLDNFEIIEMVRTGPVAMVRGNRTHSRTKSIAGWRASRNGSITAEEAKRFSTGGV